ncbi:kinase-like domain-containing protein [Gongronella butleri]|nr:kinase-like domain-containing protein [Gongronella butleri]
MTQLAAKQSSKSMHKSWSDTSTLPGSKTISSKRRSVGSVKSAATLTTATTTTTTTTATIKVGVASSAEKRSVWRAPGHYEIPNILGNAYLQPSPQKSIVPKKKATTPPPSNKPPWYPACYHNHWSPPSPPTQVKSDESLFEKRLKKAIPKISLVTQPKARFIGSKEIGTGVNGAVVQVSVRGSTLRLALKRCKLDSDREYRAAIVRELRIMATGHTNLIKLREAAVYRNEVWIAMDLMQCSVFAVLCSRGLPEEFAIYISRETLNALVYLHTKGFIHRDVKCENLLIGYNGEVKLADFGLATSTRHVNQERLGTAKWMAPEVIREDPYDEKADLWSLGITVIEMMDRVPPHYSVRRDELVFQKILESPSPTFTYSYPSIYCTGLVAWLLEEYPENRPSAKDVIHEIDMHLEQGLLKMSTPRELAAFVNKHLA